MRHILLISLFILLFSGLNTGYAQLSADPEGVTASMEVNNQAETEVIITNSGDSDVPFEIKIEAIDLSEDDDNRDVPPRRDRRGGPVDDDDYRYEWRDNDENDGPEYEWIDIREFDGVRSQSQSDDEIHGPFEFGWNIPFYDEEFDRCWICSDGWASLQRSQYARNVPDLPNNDQSWFATVLWSDGDWHGNLNGAGPAYFWTNEEDMAIVTWHQYDARDNGSHADVQVIFQDNGMITIQYGDSFGEGNRFGTGEGTYGAEAGINGLGGDYPGFQFKPPNQQNDYLVEGRAIGFGPARAWLNWIVADCEEGVIEAQSEFNLTLQLNTEDMEAGYYYSIVRLLNPENDDIVLLEFPTILSIDSPIYNITGTVTDAGNDNVIDDALVTITPYDIKRGSNNDGEYEFTNLHLGEYEFLFTAPDFLPHTETVEIDDEGDYELNVELLHSECTPSERQFTMQLEPGYTHEFEFQIDNGGNGPLTYAVDRRLLGDANAEPFELRQTDEIEDLTGDDMLAGAVFAEEQFFISGGNNGNNPNKIYVLNTDMEVVNEFDQFVDDRYGMRDLAYDGELIWGAVEGTFYGFTTTGDLEIEFSVDANLEGRAIAWDPVDEVLLASDISTDIFAINRDGDVVETYRRPAELRIYGLGVWPDDPDDCYLYVFCRGPDNVGIDAFKLNPATGEYMLAQYFDVGDGRPSGIMITNQLDVYSWVIVALVQNPDRLNVWQLAARKEWFQITPTAGVIEPDEHEGFVLTLDATGLPVDNDFCGEVVFMHDGIGQETALDVTLSVQAGRVQTTRDIDLHIGWNTISTNLQPNDNENIEGLVDSIVTTGAMIMMKNTNGDFYRPAYDFNNIQAWNSWEGFQMLMAEAATLTIAGESVLKEDPIDLTEGWQLVSYYPRYEIEATEALASIYDHLIIAKDGSGNFCLPEWDDFSNMGNLCEGQGYFIKVDADCRLVYVPEEEEERRASVISSKSVYDKPGQLPVHAVTGENMSLLVTTETSFEGEVGVYAGGELVGSGVIQNGVCGIAIWGDDLSTETIDGAISGSPLEIKLLTNNVLQDAPYTVLSGKLTYEIDGLAIIRLNSASELPLEFGIVSAYPNPFNSQMRVSYNLLETGLVDLAVYDVSGRRVAELSSGRQVSGAHTVMFNGKDMPSGVYMLRLQAGGQSSMMKIMLVK